MKKLFEIEFDNGTIANFYNLGLEIEGKLTEEDHNQLLHIISVSAQKNPKPQAIKPRAHAISAIFPIIDFLSLKSQVSPDLVGRRGIYIIRQKNQVIYVGQSNYMLSRLREHIIQKTTIGKAILETDNLETWTIELVSVKDRDDLLKKEMSYIKELKPLLNVTQNK